MLVEGRDRVLVEGRQEEGREGGRRTDLAADAVRRCHVSVSFLGGGHTLLLMF